MRPYEHSIAPGLIGGFHHKLVQVFQYVPAFSIVPADISWHIGENCVLAKIVLNDFWNIGVDDLIVRDASSRSVRQSNTARAVDVHQSGHAKEGIRPECGRVQKVVVNSAIDDVDALKAF